MAEFSVKYENERMHVTVNGTEKELFACLCAMADEFCEMTGVNPKMLGNILTTGVGLHREAKKEGVRLDMGAIKRGMHHGHG